MRAENGGGGGVNRTENGGRSLVEVENKSSVVQRAVETVQEGRKRAKGRTENERKRFRIVSTTVWVTVCKCNVHEFYTDYIHREMGVCPGCLYMYVDDDILLFDHCKKRSHEEGYRKDNN